MSVLPRRALCGVIALSALLAPAPAQAEPVTYTGQYGARVTLSSATVNPGQRIAITGEGFTRTGGTGNPYVAVKPNDLDLPWQYGNSDGSKTVVTDDAPIWFEAVNGSFSGWIDVPADIARTGPAADGRHWLRILSGVFSSDGASTTDPITFQAYFGVADRLTLGFSNSAGTFFAGNVVPTNGGALTVKGRGFDAGETATVKLGQTTLTASNATADADGDFDATATVPSGTAAGDHTLTVATSSVSGEATVRAVAHAATLITPQVRPGGTVAVAASGFVGVAGAGQRVGLVLGESVLNPGCEPAGTAPLAGTVPSGTAAGPATLRVAGGTKCAPPLVTDPFPRVVAFANGLTISPAAPQAESDAVAAAGSSIPVSFAGFATGTSVTVKLDGVALGAPITLYTESGSTTVMGNVALPGETAPGRRVLTFEGGGAAAALVLEAAPPPTAALEPATVAAGDQLTVTVGDWRRADGGGGQKVAARILTHDRAIRACIETDAQGAGTGSVAVPPDVAGGEHTLQLLAGTSCVSTADGGQLDDLPSRTRSLPFTVTVPPAGTAAPTAEPTATATTEPTATATATATPVPPALRAPRPVSVARQRSRLVVGLTGGSGAQARLVVRSAAKLRLRRGAKPRRVVLARGTTSTARVRLALTAAGKRALRRYARVRIVVTATVPGADPVARRFTLVRG